MSKASFCSAGSWMWIGIFLEAAQCESKNQISKEQNFSKYNLY